MNRLRALRKSRRLSQRQLAQELQVTQSTVSNWENHTRDIDSTTVQRLAKFFEVSTDHLLGHDAGPQEAIRTKKPARKIPLLGRVQAGMPTTVAEEVLGYCEDFGLSMDRDGDYFALVIRGNSMEPEMREGAIAVIRRQSSVDSGDHAVVIINGEDATIKRLIKKDNGIMLQPANHSYEPLFFTYEEVRKLPVIVLGKVVETRVKYY